MRQNRIQGPLFNNFDWGGFLIWYLPEYPVSLDGRTDLYGDALDQQLLRALNGDPSYKTDPYLRDAGLVLLRRRDGLTSSLESTLLSARSTKTRWQWYLFRSENKKAIRLASSGETVRRNIHHRLQALMLYLLLTSTTASLSRYTWWKSGRLPSA